MPGGKRTGRGYAVEIDEVALGQLRWLRRHDRRAANRVEDTISDRMSHEPTRRDRNRKPLTGEWAGVWEVRVQPYRVYYRVDDPARRVTVIGLFHKPAETAMPLPTE